LGSDSSSEIPEEEFNGKKYVATGLFLINGCVSSRNKIPLELFELKIFEIFFFM